MGVSYRAQVATAFEVLAEGLAPFVDDRMARAYPDEDWILMAANRLGKRRDVLVSITDPHFQLEVMNRWWGPVFAPVLVPELRMVVTELRTARNHWAHPDEDHPFDLPYATRVHQLSEELLRAVGSGLADRMAELAEDLRWDDVRQTARAAGVDEATTLMQQLGDLQDQYASLQAQLEVARLAAESATGRQRAVARQLAELQTQYAAVAGLRDDYLALQRQLEEVQARRRARDPAAGADASGPDQPDPDVLRAQLASAEMALVGLQRESVLLREHLASARDDLARADPLATEEGRRWVWLVASLIVTLGILVVIAAYLPT